MSYIAKNGRLYTSGASEALTLLDDKFSVNKSYSKGDSCIYNDYLWKFTSDKTAGEWNPSVVEQCRIMDFVDDVDGHLTQVQSQICTNILNPTAPTQTINGVTFTNNGDGTYTVNGTASGMVFSSIWQGSAIKYRGKNLCLCGCPSGGTNHTYQIAMNAYDANGTSISAWWYNGGRSGINLVPQNAVRFVCAIYVYDTTTCDNLVFKPMLTTDLSATYDDFVPYTGDSGRLNDNVAKIYTDLSDLSSFVLSPNSTYIPINENVSYNSSYTAPADGMYSIMIRQTGANGGAIYFDSDRTQTIVGSYGNAGGERTDFLVPLRKNTTIYTRNLSSTEYAVLGYYKI